MKKIIYLILLVTGLSYAQTFNEYEISFENAVHHEANVVLTFKDIQNDVLEVRMGRSSPGRYALHEFAKNIYNVKAQDSKGNPLPITRPNPYQWNVAKHDGTVKFSYTLFGDRGDGTYLQIDETHAHLNMPATFAFAKGFDTRPIKVNFKIREDLKWKIATQLKHLEGNSYMAPDFQYLMDSPAEISNFMLREFTEESNGKSYTIQIALHHPGSELTADKLFEGVKKIVRQQKAVYGMLPDYDFGTYTFLVCYMPQASGDGMEHRNSTYVTGRNSLEGEGINRALGTISHEFFHCWNVERIRPASLAPFNFERANMSGELWFAEGFTSYYTGLILCRAGLLDQKAYVESLSNSINYVKNSPGRDYFNVIEMSYQAPFADASTSIDPNNRSNTFISYYSYGEVLGLALDLSLRNLKGSYSLDGFMKSVWEKFGKTEITYTLSSLRASLAEYVTPDFSNNFFDRYIYKSELPDYKSLLPTVGVSYSAMAPNKAHMGADFINIDGGIMISDYTTIGAPAYKAGLEKGDIISSINGSPITTTEILKTRMDQMIPGKEISISYKRLDEMRTTQLMLEADPLMQTRLFEDSGFKPDADKLKRRSGWLQAK
ncbi:MAG: M61 family metallopeptidase [Cyclobacteriaceae bacterium]|nr:M61 family metallopeptidase [Cyclobacteriaceae bacterium]